MSFRRLFLVAAFAFGLAAPIGAAQADDWPAFKGGSERTAFNPDETVLGAGNVGAVTEKWRVGVAPGEIRQGPVVADGVVYIVSSKDIGAHEEATGRRIWRRAFTRTGGPAAAVAGGVVYLSFGGVSVMALDAKSGKTKWTAKTGSAVAKYWQSAPAVVKKLVYAAGSDGKLYALKVKTGKLAFAVKPGNLLIASPAISNGVAYVAAGKRQLVAYNAKNGKKMWTFKAKSVLVETPAVSDGRVYLASGSELYAVDAKTGKEIWVRTPSDRKPVKTPAVAGDKVVVKAGSVFALDAITGNTLWEYLAFDVGSSGPAIANGVVYVTDDGPSYSVALNLTTGNVLAGFTTAGGTLPTPVVVNGALYLATSSAVHAYR